jgi:hypothetical protein
MSEIPLELLNEMTPAVRAFVEALCADPGAESNYRDAAKANRGTEAPTWNELGQFIAATVERQTGTAAREHSEAKIQTQTRGSGWACETHSLADSDGSV